MSVCVDVVCVCTESKLSPVTALTHPLATVVALGRRQGSDVDLFEISKDCVSFNTSSIIRKLMPITKCKK